jgi:hypothetical protein
MPYPYDKPMTCRSPAVGRVKTPPEERRTQPQTNPTSQVKIQTSTSVSVSVSVSKPTVPVFVIICVCTLHRFVGALNSQ